MKKVLFYISLTAVISCAKPPDPPEKDDDYREKYVGNYAISSYVERLVTGDQGHDGLWIRPYNMTYIGEVFLDTDNKNKLKIRALDNDTLVATVQESGEFVFRHSWEDEIMGYHHKGRFSNDSLFFRRSYSYKVPMFLEDAVGVKLK